MQRAKETARVTKAPPRISEAEGMAILDHLRGQGKEETFRVAVRLLLREASKTVEQRE